MFVFANFLRALAEVVNIACSAYMWIIIIRAIISWFSPDPYNPMVMFFYRITDPVLRRVQRFIPPVAGVDFSPLIIIIAIVFIRNFLVHSLLDLASSLYSSISGILSLV